MARLSGPVPVLCFAFTQPAAGSRPIVQSFNRSIVQSDASSIGQSVRPSARGEKSMMHSVFCRLVTAVVAVAMLSSGFAVSASAAMISTEQAVVAAERAERLDRVGSFLARADVAAELERF